MVERRPILVVGQGLAGSLLAHELDARGADPLVVDPDQADSATRVAAGLLNPFTGPRFQSPAPVMAWFQHALESWRRMEERLGIPLLEPAVIQRLLRTEKERQRLEERRGDPAARRLLGSWEPPNPDDTLNDPLGRCGIQAARVDLPRFLDASRDWLRETGRLVTGLVTPSELQLDRHGARWRNDRWAAVVFCQGHEARTNPWFAELPWRISHGESLVLQRHPRLPDSIVSRGRNLVPLDEGRVWLGATYERQLQATRTDAGRRALIHDLGDLLIDPPPVEVLEQRAGVRAGNRHGFFFCHRHPEHPSLLIFGGLGSRGTLIAPRCAAMLADHLTAGTSLPTEDTGRP